MALTGKRLWRPKMAEISGVDRPAHLHDGWVVLKSADGAEMTVMELDEDVLAELEALDEGGNMAEEIIDDGAEPTVEERLATVEKALADETAKREVAEKALADAEAEAVAKAAGADPEEIAFQKALGEMPEPFRKRFLANEAATAEAVKKAEIEHEARVSKEYLDAAGDYGGLPVKKEELATILREVDANLPEPAAKTLRTVLKAASDTQGLRLGGLNGNGAEIGAGGLPISDAEAALKAEAAEIRKAQPDLSPAQAFTKAMTAHPELTDRAHDENGAS